MIAPDPVPMVDHGKEIEVSRFFSTREEPKWQALKGNVKWIRAVLEAHPDVKWVLMEMILYYNWWIENPKKRRPNLEACIGNWLRGESRKLLAAKERSGYVQAPTEPGKYDGIGVTYGDGDD